MFTDINARYSLAHLERNQFVKKKKKNNSKSVILTLEHASESPGGLVKISMAGPILGFLIQQAWEFAFLFF